MRLSTINIPDGVTAIGDYAFRNCSSLSSVTLPESVTEFGDCAFDYCPNLTARVYEGSVAQSYCKNNSIPYVIIGGLSIDSLTAVQSLTASGQVQVTYTVKTPVNATQLYMYSESGAQIATFTGSNASYTDSGSTRTWTVKYTFINDGMRTMYFAASDGSSTGDKQALPMTLCGAQVQSAAFNPTTAEQGTAAKATVRTSSGASYLHMYSEDGSLIKTWAASGNSTASGSVRTWSISYSFVSAGNRTMTFKASTDNANPKSGVQAKLTVVAGTPIVSAVCSHSSITAQNTLTFTVKTGTEANYLKMYAEGGGLVKTWTAGGNSQDSGSVRTWTLPYAFANAGNRTVTFKASKDGVNMGTGKSVSVKVLAVPAVTSAACSHASITAQNTLTFTVRTPANAYVLSLYSENGTRVKTWYTGDSTLSGDVRTWKLSYAFMGAGDRVVTLKASADGSHYGTGKSVSVKVLAVPEVRSAAFSKATAKAGESVTIVVETPANAYNLHMFLESGALYRTWHSADYATKTENGVVWNIPYAFGGTGTRKLTFKASADGSHYGTGKTATITIQ